jgi:hypothetical protein
VNVCLSIPYYLEMLNLGLEMYHQQRRTSDKKWCQTKQR